MFRKISFSGFTSGFNNFSFGMLFSVFFHGTIFFATIFALPFVAKKPLELMPIVSVELIQISEKTNIPYAPKAAKIIAKILAVSKNRTDTRIYVRGDKTINYGRVLEIMGLLSGSGFTKVALISEPYKER